MVICKKITELGTDDSEQPRFSEGNKPKCGVVIITRLLFLDCALQGKSSSARCNCWLQGLESSGQPVPISFQPRGSVGNLENSLHLPTKNEVETVSVP